MTADRDPIREAQRQWVRHGWADAADGMAMVTSLVRVQQLLIERIDAVLRPLELTFARYEVLRLLSFSRRGSLPMSRLGLAAPGAPHQRDQRRGPARAPGLRRRGAREKDRRVVLAALTDRGPARVVGARHARCSTPRSSSDAGLAADQVARSPVC